jgi:hypothetical protein
MQREEDPAADDTTENNKKVTGLGTVAVHTQDSEGATHYAEEQRRGSLIEEVSVRVEFAQ